MPPNFRPYPDVLVLMLSNTGGLPSRTNWIRTVVMVSTRLLQDSDSNADQQDVYWPPYNSTNEGVVMSLQDQGGITVKPGPDTMRQGVYVCY